MKRFVFLLHPAYQLLGLVSAIEALRVANSVSAEPFYSVDFVHDGETAGPADVASSSGITIRATRHLSELEQFDVLIVCTSFRHQEHVNAATGAALRRFARFGKELGSFESGIYHLAQAGVMDGHKATAHFNNLPLFQQLFPEIEFVRSVFTCGQGRMTASGGSACLDLMLHVIESDLGAVVATRVASLVCHQARRRGETPQDGLLTARGLGHQPAVRAACRLMEERIASGAGGTDEVARAVGVSRRHLDRMFRAAFGCTVSDYFRQIRLARARKLVKGTRMEFGEISGLCGFASYSHFLMRYREEFGLSPSQDRTVPNLVARDPGRIRPSDDLHPFQTGLDLTRMY